MPPGSTATRPISLTREGDHFRLAFPYNDATVTRVKTLPYASFDPSSKTWTALVCAESVDRLRAMHYEGLCDVSVDDLVAGGETLVTCAAARLRSGSRKRPFVVAMAWRDDHLYTRLRAVPGAAWDKRLAALTYPQGAGPALAELVERGVLDDPDGLLRPADTVVAFDIRTGRFVILGDERAQGAFDQHFPERDVVAAWIDKGLDVAFADDFSAEIYASERARIGSGLAPAGLLMPLYDYQARSVACAVERSGFGIWHAPGLGKTAVAIAAGHELMANRHSVERCVVVCPGSVRTQWRLEIERFTGEDRIVVVDGSAKKRKEAYAAAAEARWLVVHYDVLSRDIAQLQPLAAGAYLIADEAHRVKSPQAKRTKALHALGKVAARRLALTGTPVESVPDEWYWVMHFAVPGCLGDSTDFLNRYMYPSRWGFEGARNLDELRRRSLPHFLRYTKAEVAEHLPPLRVQHLPLDPDPAYAAVLRRAHREAREEIAADRRARAGQHLTGLLDGPVHDELEAGAEMTAVGLLRALCTSPRLVAQSEAPAAAALRAAGVVPDVDGPKLDELRVRAGELQNAGERVVIFTYSKRMARLIAERFTEDSVRYVLFTGDSSSAERDEACRRFTDPDDDVTAFIATDAAAEGLNLGTCCSTLINVDVPWTPTRLEQRSNRIHRVDGTASAYLVVNLTVRGTIEEGILRMVEHKADISDAIFGEAGGRARTTGRRGGQTYFEDALKDYFDEPPIDEPPDLEPPDLDHYVDGPGGSHTPDAADLDAGAPEAVDPDAGAPEAVDPDAVDPKTKEARAPRSDSRDSSSANPSAGFVAQGDEMTAGPRSITPSATPSGPETNSGSAGQRRGAKTTERDAGAVETQSQSQSQDQTQTQDRDQGQTPGKAKRKAQGKARDEVLPLLADLPLLDVDSRHTREA